MVVHHLSYTHIDYLYIFLYTLVIHIDFVFIIIVYQSAVVLYGISHKLLQSIFSLPFSLVRYARTPFGYSIVSNG